MRVRNPRNRGQKSAIRIVDVGTGSGVIALSLAKQLPESEVVAIDISDDALLLARENAARLGLSERVQFRKGDLFNNLPERFDLIVANLPYVSTEDRQKLSREVLHDPEVALFAGARGDELTRQLFAQGPVWLRPGGMLAMEIGTGQSEALVTVLEEKNYRDIWTQKDYSGVIRFLFARYG